MNDLADIREAISLKSIAAANKVIRAIRDTIRTFQGNAIPRAFGAGV